MLVGVIFNKDFIIIIIIIVVVVVVIITDTLINYT